MNSQFYVYSGHAEQVAILIVIVLNKHVLCIICYNLQDVGWRATCQSLYLNNN